MFVDTIDPSNMVPSWGILNDWRVFWFGFSKLHRLIVSIVQKSYSGHAESIPAHSLPTLIWVENFQRSLSVQDTA